MPNDKYLNEEFEKDMWLFLDEDLPAERMNFWKNQIKKNDEIKKKLNETILFLTEYNNFSSEELEQGKIKQIVANATKHERTFSKLYSWFKFENESKNFIPKLAFASSLTLAALVMLFLSQKPNPVNRINNEGFLWNDEETTNQVQNISNIISLMEDENLKKFILYKTTEDEWNKSIYKIENRIKNQDNKIDENSL